MGAIRGAAEGVHHSNFQPRVPAGNTGGGQWSNGAADGGRIRVAVRDPRLIARFLERLLRPKPEQSIRELDGARRAMETLRRVHELDPRWWPRVDGELTSPESIVEQAERRLAEFGHLAPEQLIERYRTENRMPDLFGHPSWPEDKGTVAVAIIDGKPMFGVNSLSPGRRQADTIAADRMRSELVSKYPDVMETEFLGRMPNDAVYHAEATILLRAARSHGGSLHGQELQVHVDRPMCDSCNAVLPLVARELGNPTITFTDRNGIARTLRNGRWIQAGGL